jgi:molybdopterin biosynthesis enzyme MoaB
MEIVIGVLTVSDRVSQKLTEDFSGPKILEIFKSGKDDFKVISSKLSLTLFLSRL